MTPDSKFLKPPDLDHVILKIVYKIWGHFILFGRIVQFQNSVHRYVFSLKILWQRLRIKALGIYVNFRHYCTHPSSSVIKDFDNSWYIRREQSSLSFLYFAVKVHHSVYLDLLATKNRKKENSTHVDINVARARKLRPSPRSIRRYWQEKITKLNFQSTFWVSPSWHQIKFHRAPLRKVLSSFSSLLWATGVESTRPGNIYRQLFSLISVKVISLFWALAGHFCDLYTWPFWAFFILDICMVEGEEYFSYVFRCMFATSY